MNFQSIILYILLSTSATKVCLLEISTNPRGFNSIQSSYYLEADTNSNHIDPNEELKRTQRSFLKKLWKDSGLQDLFGDDGCINCCNNDNYNAGEGDTYETPPTSSYTPYFQQIPSLSPLQPFDPLRIFQPFLKPLDFNTNGINGGGQTNTYGKGNIPKVYEGENSNLIIKDKKGYSNTNSEAGEGTECKDVQNNRVIDNNGYSSDKSNNIGPIYTEENQKNYNKNSKDTYQTTGAEPEEDVHVYPELKSKEIQTQQAYPSLDGSNGIIVYQPIIYVSPQYHAVPPLYNAAYNSNQKSEECNLPPSCNNFKGGPNIKVTHSDENLPCAMSPYSTVLSNYTPLPSSGPFLSPGASTYGVVSQRSDTKVTPSDITVYTLVTQIPSTINKYDKEPSPPITLTQADQPYRNCPELFTDYLNQAKYNQNRAKSNTLVNAQIISC